VLNEGFSMLISMLLIFIIVGDHETLNEVNRLIYQMRSESFVINREMRASASILCSRE